MRTFLILPIVGLLLSAFNPAMAAADTKISAEPIPSAVFIGSSDWAGPIYTTSAGMTLYTTAMDERKPGVFGCSGTRSEKGRRAVSRCRGMNTGERAFSGGYLLHLLRG